MPSITNDQQLRAALENLSVQQQRTLGARFAGSVSGISEDPRLQKALETAMNTGSSEQELEDAHKIAKSIATKTYTACGRDADWIAQAEHFFAASCTAALTPDSLASPDINLAWKAAMQARMAKNCMMIQNDAGELDNEAQKQYRLAEEFSAP
jgi:hypothetical protein